MNIIEKLYDFSPIGIQNILVSIEGLRRKRMRIDNSYFIKWKKIINKLERTKENKIIQWQNRKLTEYIEEAYINSEFWKSELSKIGYKKGQKITYDNLKELPIIDKNIVISKKELFFNRNQKKNDYILAHTSGTTGSGLKFRWSKEAMGATFSFYWNLIYYKNSLGDKYATFNGNPIVPFNQSTPPFWRLNSSMNQTLFSIFHMKKEFLHSYFLELQKGNFQFINGYPSAIYELADYLYSNNLELKGIKAIYPSSETLFDWQKKIISNAFNAPIVDLYMNGEQSILAYQCENEKYHIVPYFSAYWFKDSGVYYEGQRLYEVIGTSFINNSTFLVNYRTGDLVILDKDNICNCGRKGRIIKKIIGRVEDVIITPDGRKIGRLDHLFKDSEDVKEAQIIQLDINKIIIKIVLRGDNFKSKDKILKNARNRLGEKIKIKFEIVPKIERTRMGKLKAVISHLTK